MAVVELSVLGSARLGIVVFLEVGTHSAWADVELSVFGSQQSVRVGVEFRVWGRHSVRAGIVLLIFGNAGLGIVVFFDDNVHVHVCHEIAQERHGL